MNWAKPDMLLPAALDVIGVNYQGEGIRQFQAGVAERCIYRGGI
jgi:beta-galactosidase